MRRFIVILVVLGLLAGGLFSLYRVWRILPYPVGSGESKPSPDGQAQASITDYYDESFLGHRRRWFEFEVKSPVGVQRWISDPVPFADFGSRSQNSVIRWSDDSASVRFVFPKMQVEMKAK
jgi:hypothetical protein